MSIARTAVHAGQQANPDPIVLAASDNPMIERFDIDHAWPNWAVNRWISGMFKLFKLEIEALFGHRDQVVSDWCKNILI